MAMGAYVVKRGVCTAKEGGPGVMHGERGHVWQERRPVKRAVRILLVCILVCNFCE